jgi:peroxiredoxin
VKLLIALLASALSIFAQQTKISWTESEKPIFDRIRTLRNLPDSQRPSATKDLALKIRQLPATPGKPLLAIQLANLVTEGDPGHDTLQETSATLATALREQPAKSDDPYFTLAQLVRYEHVEASIDDPRFLDAMAKLEADDEHRQHLDFTLTDLDGKHWTLRQLTGKVVLVNFWATWCPPCRKEMPDLDAIYGELRDKGLVILAISDEDRTKVASFVAEHKVSYPVLLDPGRRVNDLFVVRGIPKSFVYDRSGHLVAESIDMRTRKQFMEMLGRAGLIGTELGSAQPNGSANSLVAEAVSFAREGISWKAEGDTVTRGVEGKDFSAAHFRIAYQVAHEKGGPIRARFEVTSVVSRNNWTDRYATTSIAFWGQRAAKTGDEVAWSG